MLVIFDFLVEKTNCRIMSASESWFFFPLPPLWLHKERFPLYRTLVAKVFSKSIFLCGVNKSFHVRLKHLSKPSCSFSDMLRV